MPCSVAVDQITVLGAGTMGHGIAHVAAQAGYRTILFDIDEAAVDRGMSKIRANLAKGVEKGKITPELRDQTLANLAVSTDLEPATAAADLVIEAVPERADIKQQLY